MRLFNAPPLNAHSLLFTAFNKHLHTARKHIARTFTHTKRTYNFLLRDLLLCAVEIAFSILCTYTWGVCVCLYGSPTSHSPRESQVHKTYTVQCKHTHSRARIGPTLFARTLTLLLYGVFCADSPNPMNQPAAQTQPNQNQQQSTQNHSSQRSFAERTSTHGTRARFEFVHFPPVFPRIFPPFVFVVCVSRTDVTRRETSLSFASESAGVFFLIKNECVARCMRVCIYRYAYGELNFRWCVGVSSSVCAEKALCTGNRCGSC